MTDTCDAKCTAALELFLSVVVERSNSSIIFWCSGKRHTVDVQEEFKQLAIRSNAYYQTKRSGILKQFIFPNGSTVAIGSEWRMRQYPWSKPSIDRHYWQHFMTDAIERLSIVDGKPYIRFIEEYKDRCELERSNVPTVVTRKRKRLLEEEQQRDRVSNVWLAINSLRSGVDRRMRNINRWHMYRCFKLDEVDEETS